ncbi:MULTISPECIES: DUF5983 family protein [Klebsiella]|uniref:DUF5983 family protein n=1 Tax=Klebsiella TaxID=570 RepID=UPI000F68668C|nr:MULTISPECIES: hypothetical protein [Klebsiella]RRZ70212.1 hypothetical protein EGK39_23765 [Klebsiella oxytoca]
MSLNITESYKVAVISTAHVTQADSEILPQISFDPITDRGYNWIHGTEYGWIVRAGLRAESWKESLREEGISWPTIENIEKVLNAGFEVVHFDRDADAIDGLYLWEW